MIIVDTTVLVESMLGDQPLSDRARHALMRDPHWAAPVHQPVEFLNALRALSLGKKVTESAVTIATQRFRAGEFEHFAVVGELELMDRIWELRHNLTPYDAAYVALAETLDVTLLTSDVKLATSSGPRCRFELIR